MKRVGIVSYNMYGNFTNYGSALQSYALQHAIDKVAPGEVKAIIVDYCPDVLADKDVLNPMGNMWDTDPAARERCRLTLPAIRENYAKFKRFYDRQYSLTSQKYTSSNFNDSLATENLDGYVCGSDTVFAVPEFGFDDGFYASYPVMQQRSVAYAASFGDYDIATAHIPELKQRLHNFQAIALRENDKKPLVESLTDAPVYKVIDPTLLLTPEEYAGIIEEPEIKEPYLLLYSRRGDIRMQDFAEDFARLHGLQIIEISLNAQNAARHTMRYDAGVEEFLGLVKNAAVVITNSFHGMIFAVQFKRPFYIFSRKLCDTKIKEVLDLFGLPERLITTDIPSSLSEIQWDDVHCRISQARKESQHILETLIYTI
ncbi:MAG: polysaccharide pyruvyl transferase family protein [Muribaculaceae bacterium]|nr:polysaccharide pyruvyl transferase family protein [Muribaculaceae bacterium]